MYVEDGHRLEYIELDSSSNEVLLCRTHSTARSLSHAPTSTIQARTHALYLNSYEIQRFGFSSGAAKIARGEFSVRALTNGCEVMIHTIHSHSSSRSRAGASEVMWEARGHPLVRSQKNYIEQHQINSELKIDF